MLIAQYIVIFPWPFLNLQKQPKICQNHNIDNEYESMLPDDEATEVFNVVGSAVTRVARWSHLGSEI